MMRILILTLRAVMAILAIAIGVDWLVKCAPVWYAMGFPVTSYGNKGKDTFSGVLFSLVFVGYGIVDLGGMISKSKSLRSNRSNAGR